MNKSFSITTLETLFPPDPLGRLRYEFAREFARRGHKVTVITRYPPISFAGRGDSLAHKLFHYKFLESEELEHITVIRVAPRRGLEMTILGKAMSQLLAPVSLTLTALLRGRVASVIHCSSPPLLLALGASLSSMALRKPLVVRIHDLHPDALIKMGLLKNRFLIRVLQAVEKFVYLRASGITVISPRYKTYITSLGIPEKKVKVIPNWYQSPAPAPRPTRLPADMTGFRTTEKILLTYAGSLYWAQDLDIVLDSAKLLTDREGIEFLIVGEGPKKAELVSKAKMLGLANVRFLPLQERDAYLKIVNASRACIVTIADNYTSPTLPSKVPELMGLGKPILVKAPRDSEVSRLAREASCGLVTNSGNPEEFVKLVLELSESSDMARELGANGKRYASKFFSLNICIDKYEELFNGVC